MSRAAKTAWKKPESKVRELRRQVAVRDKKIEALEEENRVLKLQLREYRDKFFKKNKRKDSDEDEKEPLPKKRGAPKGHPGRCRNRHPACRRFSALTLLPPVLSFIT